MVSFDARTPGTPAQTWTADARFHDRPALDLEGVSDVLVVAAHPDDETLGAGGLIARCVERGIPVHVVVVTDGSIEAPPQLREEELAAAMAVLGATWVTLGFDDGATDEQRDDIRLALAPLIAQTGETALIVAPWTGDGHSDHQVVGEVVAQLASRRRLIAYPIWMWHWGQPSSPEVPWESFVTVDIDRETKARALSRFTSQMSGDDPVLRADFVQNFDRDELFVLSGGTREGLAEDYFDEVYSAGSDPWGFETRAYEARKRAVTLASLPDESYATGLEIGCSIGTLTEGLAQRVDDLLALDISQAAVDSARARVGDSARVERADVLTDFPPGTFELIVLSEVGYYFSAAELERVLDAVEAALDDDGTVLACHWRHPVDDYPLSGDQVHEAIRRRGLPALVAHVEEDFVLEVFSRDPRSVARRTGLL